MRKKILISLSLILAVLCFTGCLHAEEQFTVLEDGSGTVSSAVRIEKASVDQLADSMGITAEEILGEADTDICIVDGVEYYELDESADFNSYDELKQCLEAEEYSGVYVSADGIRYRMTTGVTAAEVEELKQSDLDFAESMSYHLRITMTSPINMSTGTISEDGMTAEFVIKGDDFYKTHDIVVSMKEETTKPTLSGATAKKTYNSARTITANDASGIKKVQYRFKAPGSSTYGKYQTFDAQKTFTKNGTYSVRAYDYYGNKAVKYFTIKDTKKPAVTLNGTMNKKQTYYKNRCVAEITDNCEVKSIKYYLDGERVKVSRKDILTNGLTVEEEGTHKIIAEDVNGNKRTVTFKVKHVS